MSDVAEYERRIAGALARIGTGLSRLRAAPAADSPQPEGAPAAADDGLRAALAEEQVVTAQLQERLRALHDRHEAREAAVQAERAGLRDRLAQMDDALQGLRQSQAELTELVTQLRAAVAEDVAEPDLVNRAMQAEIDGLRALRIADAAEVDAVIAELRPLIEEGR